MCDASHVYIGKTKRHLGLRSKEHLDLEKETPWVKLKSIKNLVEFAEKVVLKIFKLLKEFLNDQEAKINEAIIIKNRKSPT